MQKFGKNAYLWALFDFSNSIFLTNFLVIYFPQWLLNEKNLPDIVYSVAVAFVSIMTGILLPNIGALSDIHGSRIYFFRIFVVLAWLASFLTAISAVFFPGSMGIILSIIFFSFSYFCFQPTLVIYDSMLSSVASKKKQALLSGIGVILGFIGQLLGLAVAAYFISTNPKHGAAATFFPTSFLFIIWALPTLIWLREPGVVYSKIENLQIKDALKRVKSTFMNIRDFQNIFYFFLSYFFYSNAIVTVTAFTVVYTEKVLGFTGQSKIPLYVAGTIFAIIGAFLSGILSNKLGLKRFMVITLFSWLICFSFGTIATTPIHGWLLAIFLGLLTGITWTISRLIIIQLSPPEKLTELFGFFGLAGRLATTLGPLLWGFIVLLFAFMETNKYRIALISMNILVLLSLYFFFKIQDVTFKISET